MCSNVAYLHGEHLDYSYLSDIGVTRLVPEHYPREINTFEGLDKFLEFHTHNSWCWKFQTVLLAFKDSQFLC